MLGTFKLLPHPLMPHFFLSDLNFKKNESSINLKHPPHTVPVPTHDKMPKACLWSQFLMVVSTVYFHEENEQDVGL